MTASTPVSDEGHGNNNSSLVEFVTPRRATRTEAPDQPVTKMAMIGELKKGERCLRLRHLKLYWVSFK
jgi:hypothetical protein